MKQLSIIQQSLKAPKAQKNSFGGYNYRSCEDILEAVKPLLGECFLTLADEMVELAGRIYVKAVATLGNGTESISTTAYAREPESRKGMDESQITGSASSYARKYALSGLLCIDDSRDGDDTGKGDDAPAELLTEVQKGNIMVLSETANMEAADLVIGIRWASGNRTEKIDELGTTEAARLIGVINKKITKAQEAANA